MRSGKAGPVIWPAAYLLVWLLILGSAVVYAAEWREFRICAISGTEHEDNKRRITIRKSHIVAMQRAADVTRSHCSAIVMTNGSTVFVYGKYDT